MHPRSDPMHPHLIHPNATAVPVTTPDGTYDVLLGRGLLEQAGQLLQERRLTGRVAVVTDTNVGPLHVARVLGGLAAAGLTSLTIEVPAGEAHKTLEMVRSLYDAFLDANLDRGDTVLALGGGVVGDMAGFAAATYMRGMPLVQAPTTILAMVDASIGGKVGVDLPRGKNLVGAFKQPALTVADLSTLDTLPVEEVRAGLAEVVKHGIIADPELFVMLEQGAFRVDKAGAAEHLPILARAVAVKVDVVSEDPYEGGRRMVLNLGHTFAHALETRSGYAMRHGEAVAVGLVAAARVACEMALCGADLPPRVEALLQRIGLPIRYRGPTPDSLWEAMAVDKKRRSGRPRFVLPQAIGQVVIREDVPQQPVLMVLGELRE